MEEIVVNKHKFNILSIDIGIKNLGFAILSFDKLGKKKIEDFSVMFDIFDISKHLKKKGDIVNCRCEALITWLHELKDTYTDFKTVIIERQVNRNTMAMELMYALVMGLRIINPVADIIIFDPKDKFLKLGLEYSTQSKSHKKQSTRYAKTLIHTFWSCHDQYFDDFDKKDDVSDAINQALVWLLSNGILSYSVEEYVSIIQGMSVKQITMTEQTISSPPTRHIAKRRTRRIEPEMYLNDITDE